MQPLIKRGSLVNNILQDKKEGILPLPPGRKEGAIKAFIAHNM